MAKMALAPYCAYVDVFGEGSTISEVLQVAPAGRGEAGKTSIRKALAGRPIPRPAQNEHISKSRYNHDDMTQRQLCWPVRLTRRPVTLVCFLCGRRRDGLYSRRIAFEESAHVVLAAPRTMTCTVSGSWQMKHPIVPQRRYRHHGR